MSDPTPGRRRETRASWLKRSTWSRAVETRRFYNENLAALPADAAAALCHRLHVDKTEAPTFELIVGRFLQLRGADDVTWEPDNGHSRRVDWRARFPDGVLHVEAMVPVYNAGAGTEARRRARLHDAIDQLVPKGWWISVHHLPRLGESEPLAGFRRAVREALDQLPDPETPRDDEPVVVRGAMAEDWVELAGFRSTTGNGGIGMESSGAYFDNSELVVVNAWADKRKRDQGRSVPPPALLALKGGFIGADLEAFEFALFGRSVRQGGEPDGALAKDRRPPWAGVLAFPEVGVAGGLDPVVFLSPHYEGDLPAAVGRLEVRRLGPSGLQVQPAENRDVLEGMRWASADRD